MREREKATHALTPCSLFLFLAEGWRECISQHAAMNRMKYAHRRDAQSTSIVMNSKRSRKQVRQVHGLPSSNSPGSSWELKLVLSRPGSNLHGPPMRWKTGTSMSVVALEMRGSETGEGALVGCRTCCNLPEPVVVIVEEGLKQACSVDRLKKAY